MQQKPKCLVAAEQHPSQAKQAVSRFNATEPAVIAAVVQLVEKLV
jgi:hypothetical protein